MKKRICSIPKLNKKIERKNLFLLKFILPKINFSDIYSDKSFFYQIHIFLFLLLSPLHL